MKSWFHASRLLVIIGVATGGTLLPAAAQSVNSSHGIGRVDKDKTNSRSYLARTPYTLHWRADPKYKLYGKKDPTVKVESYLAGIHVYDAVTRRLITSTKTSPLTGEIKVPVAGHHMVKVFCTGPVDLSFEEDKTALEAAARRGELKDWATLDAAKAGSMRTKNEKIEALKAVAIKQLEDQRARIGDDAVAALRLDAERAAQLASSEDDFNVRFKALSAATVERFKASRNAAVTAAAETPAEAPRSSWDGNGLPPGMTRIPKSEPSVQDLPAAAKETGAQENTAPPGVLTPAQMIERRDARRRQAEAG